MSCRYILPKTQKGAANSEGDTAVKDKEDAAAKEALWICQVMSGDRGDVSIVNLNVTHRIETHFF